MKKTIKFIDLFCGIGGFRFAITQAAKRYHVPIKCVLSSDIDIHANKAYKENFGEIPQGDIRQITEKEIPDHDLLLAGFPCQPFSIIGDGKGFEDARGTLFFEIARILKAKKPKAFVLENVKRLVSHEGGRTLKRIMETLEEIGYEVNYKVLNALDFGLPQKRERAFIVGSLASINYSWPEGSSRMKALNEILEKKIPKKYFASEAIVFKRKSIHKSNHHPSIWHENKAGNICSYPYSCALRAGASYNYLLVNGERRLTPREMLRLQGFPEDFKIVCNDYQTRKQAGNALPVPVAEAVISGLLPYLVENKNFILNEERKKYTKKVGVQDGRRQVPTNT